MKRSSGVYLKAGTINHFIPDPLPTHNPPFKLTKKIATQVKAAEKSLKKLEEIAQKLPDTQRFVKAYVLKEALLSSEIEGIHTTLLEALTQTLETNQKKIPKNTRLVLNYTHTLDYIIRLMHEKNLPISTRVLLHAHKILMGSEAQADPGKYRRQAVRVGALVPPPAENIADLMNTLEHYINNDNTILPPLIRIGLVHVQFETIHPFLDGNGRIGRLLIVLMMLDMKLLSTPILYPSLYFKRNRFEYYHSLDSVRTKGNFEGWISFYIKAINTASKDAYQRIKKIEKLIKTTKKSLASYDKLRVMKISAEKLINIFSQHPVLSIEILAKKLKRNHETATKIIQCCNELTILEKTTSPKNTMLFCFKMYLDILDEDIY